MKKIVFLVSFFLSFALQAQQVVHIIPEPVNLELKTGSFLIDASTSISYNAKDKSVEPTILFFKEYIKRITGTALQINTKKNKNIRFEIQKTNEIGDEGYLLNVNPNEILITANTPKGLFYGVQSLIQTLPITRTNRIAEIPCMQIKDYPRFQWRGLMLDTSRHFFPADMVKEFIDLLSLYKMNVFHWHLVDGAGWRLEIKKYPKLTQQAAWRIDDTGKPWNWSGIQFSDDFTKSIYGGFYTQEEVKDIVDYAKVRNITIIPEIEMPGHTEALLAAYPELSCNGKVHFGNGGTFPASTVDGSFCAGNDKAFDFLQDVLTEVMALFPSKYIHIGGDEVDKTNWKNCPKCQARMKSEGLKNEEELQSYFVKRIEKFIVSKNRKMIGWDEILEGGLAPEATVMSWRGEAGGIEASKMGHDVIMTPATPLYFDYYQGDSENEPQAFGGFNTLKRIYNYDPIPKELTAEQAKHILGSQANLWTEYITTREQVEYMILPRMLALSEVVWSPKEKRNWDNFSQKLKPHLTSFEQKGFRYSKGNFKVDINAERIKGTITVSLSSENNDGTIYYSTDGSFPNIGSKKYEKPFEINGTTTVRAILVVDNKTMVSKPAEQRFTFNKATGKDVKYEKLYSKNYQGTGNNSLTDGFKGTKNHYLYWHGFEGDDVVATVDLGTLTDISSISIGTIQNFNNWMFMPKWVKFEISVDGINFKEVETILNPVPTNVTEVMLNDITTNFAKQKAKVIRVTAKNIGVCPEGSPGAGKPAWLFVDEITVE
ncbi:glycoside hydrolase family 20 protein [Flavobacterium aquiphilum]|uniref:glycoside hydrolase family 20 protein n=1 Tax=Flavobacterium aquiphilum TaxID=3003261 RepID=UPI0024803B1E|nr:family 20 glycosylhydrolase [Flavobacterium aquiphilum]